MRGIIVNSILFLIAFGAFGQKRKVELIVSPDVVSIGQSVNITIKSNMDGELVENLPSAFIKGYGVNTYSQYIQDVNTGNMIQEHIVVINGAFSKAGTYKVGPFYVKDGNISKKSNVVTVKVSSGPVTSTVDFSKDQLKKPAFGIIERSSNKVYEGQALVLNARVYSKYEPTGQPLLKRNYEVDGIVESHDLNQFSKNYIETTTLKKTEYYTFSYDKRVIFPSTIGKLQITPFNIMIPYGNQGYDVQSNIPSIEVLPLPAGAPKNFIGAVGKFEVSQEVISKNLKQGDVFTLNITISGEGNLHNLEKPKLALPSGMIIYGDPTLTEEYTFGSKGAQGSITYSFNIQVTKAGDQTVPATSLSYFDPVLEKYIVMTAPTSESIHVDVSKSFEVDNTVVEEQTTTSSADQLAPISEFKASKNSNLFGTPIFWLGLTAPLFAAFLFLFFLKKRSENSEKKEEIATVKYITQKSIDYLNDAKLSLKSDQSTDFYTSIEKGMRNICIAASKLDQGTIYSRFDLYENLLAKGVSQASIDKVKTIFEQCDNARYGIAGIDLEKDNLLALAQQAYKELLG